MTTAGKIVEYPIPIPDARPVGITAGPDGAVWFAEESNQIGQLILG